MDGFAEDEDGEEDSEDGHEVDGETSVQGADFLHRHGVEDVGDDGGEDADVGQPEESAGVEREGGGGVGGFPEEEGGKDEDGDEDLHAGEAKAVDGGGDVFHPEGVECPADHGEEDGDVAGVDGEVEEAGGFTVEDDAEDAGEGEEEAEDLGGVKFLAVEEDTKNHDESGDAGVEEDGVGGGGAVQPFIDEGVEGGDADDGDGDNFAPVLAVERPFAVDDA